MSSPQPPPGPLPPNINRGPQAVAIFWVQAAIATTVIIGRFWSRCTIRNVGADDWWMLITLSVFLAFCGVLTYSNSMGGLRHTVYINPSNLEQIGINSFIIQVLGIFAFGSAKVSVGCMILRLLPPSSKWRKWSVRIIIWFTFLFNIANMIITFAQCSPPRALWEPTIPHTCWDPEVQLKIAYVGTAENIAVDIFLNIVPISLVWGLQIKKSQRVNLSILLGLGSLAAICAIVKMAYLQGLGERSDITWYLYDAIMWSGSEIFVILVCGSIHPLKPLWDRYVTKKTPMDLSDHHRYGYPHGSYAAGGSSHNKSDKRDSRQINSRFPINATTDIEISSTRKGSESLSDESKREPWEF